MEGYFLFFGVGPSAAALGPGFPDGPSAAALGRGFPDGRPAAALGRGFSSTGRGQVMFAPSGSQNSRIRSKRYHCRWMSRPGGGTAAGSARGGKVIPLFSSTKRSSTSPGSFFTKTTPGASAQNLMIIQHTTCRLLVVFTLVNSKLLLTYHNNTNIKINTRQN